MNTRHASAPEPLIALGLAAGPVVALGFTRFAYALLLPAMKADLHWTFAAAGGMNSANAAGYILGAGSGAWWARRHGSRVTFTWAVALSAVLLLLGGISTNYTVLAALRFLGGLTTAVAFVVGSALASRIHSGTQHHRTALLVALYMAGVGIGVVLAGIAVPAMLAGAGQANAWRIGWVVLGLLAAVAVSAAAWAARQIPEPATGAVAEREPLRFGRLTPTVGWYVLYGAGYVSYMTFVVALLHSHGISTAGEAAFFITLGIASTLATLLVWGRIIARLHGGQALALTSVLVLLGVLPVLVSHSLTAAFVSAVVFGASFMAGPTAVTVLARRVLPAHGWTAGIAYLTVAFSVGQAVGPLVAGVLSDASGGISKGLWLSVVLLALAGAAALLQREPSTRAASITRDASPACVGFDRILLTVDGAPHSVAAERAAVALSRALGARLDVVHVDPDTDATSADGQRPAGVAVLDEAVGRLAAAGVAPVGHLVQAPDADIPDVLAETVTRLGADLVIAAPHHRAHLQRWLEPSVSEELATRAKAAVLLVA